MEQWERGWGGGGGEGGGGHVLSWPRAAGLMPEVPCECKSGAISVTLH